MSNTLAMIASAALELQRDCAWSEHYEEVMAIVTAAHGDSPKPAQLARKRRVSFKREPSRKQR